jgi:hypothetical protein
MKSKNPFEQPDAWQEIFEQDDSYVALKKKQYNLSFRAQRRIQNQEKTQQNKIKAVIQSAAKNPFKLLTNLNPLNMNLTHITKLSFATLTILAALTTGVAAQALAPDSYKPIQVAQSIKDKYFSVNKQKDADPSVALVPDVDNYLVYLKECDLSLKYPKTAGGNELYFTKQVGNRGSEFILSPKDTRKNTDESNPDSFTTEIRCFPTDNSLNQSSIGQFSSARSEEKKLNFTPLSTSEMKIQTGWFLSENVTNIKLVTYTNNSESFEKYMYDEYSFEKGGNSFFVKIDKKKSKNAFNFNDLQLQFGSQIDNGFGKNIKYLENIPTNTPILENIINLSYSDSLNYIKNFDSLSLDNIIYSKDTKNILNNNLSSFTIKLDSEGVFEIATNKKLGFYDLTSRDSDFKEVAIDKLNTSIVNQKIISILDDKNVLIKDETSKIGNNRKYSFVGKLKSNLNISVSVTIENTDVYLNTFSLK